MGATITDEKIIYRNDTPTFTFTIKQNGLAYNLTGATVKFAAKTSVDATSYTFSKTCTISDATNGECTATLTATDTATAGTYIAELQVTTSASAVITAKQFYLIISKDIYTD